MLTKLFPYVDLPSFIAADCNTVLDERQSRSQTSEEKWEIIATGTRYKTTTTNTS